MKQSMLGRGLLCLFALVVANASPIGIEVALAQSESDIPGTEGTPVEDFYDGYYSGTPLISIIPLSSTSVGNCIPFGSNTAFGFTGFIYRNVGAFSMKVGDRIRFDLGALNSVDIRRNIYFAVANKNPIDPPLNQGVAALSWTQVVTDSQIPTNSKGNTVVGDFELTYLAEFPFTFPGGGLIVGFGGSPPGAFADFGCEQVLVRATTSDASGLFYSRFCFQPNLTLGVLDTVGTCGATFSMTSQLAGMVIESSVTIVDLDIKPGSCPNSFNRNSHGVLPVGLLGREDFDITQVDVSSVLISRDGVDGSAAPNEGPPGPHSVFADVGTPFDGELCDCHELEGDGILDLSMKFRTQEVVAALELNDLPPGALVELCVSGELLDGTEFEACDCVRFVPPGDIDVDGAVGAADLLMLLGAWGPCTVAQECLADLDEDGNVNISDLLMLLANWS